MVTRREKDVRDWPAKRARRLAGTGEPRLRPVGRPLPVVNAGRRTADFPPGLADLFEHLGHIASAPVLRGAGGVRKSSSRRSLIIVSPESHGGLGRTRHALRSRLNALSRFRRHGGGDLPCRPPPCADPAFAGGLVPPAFVLPSACALRRRSGRRCPVTLRCLQPAHR